MARAVSGLDPELDDWLDFVGRRLGGKKWLLAHQLTRARRAQGYEVALSRAEYDALRREWEVERFGAPLAVLERAAPKMFAALTAVEIVIGRGHTLAPDGPGAQAVLSVLAEIEGRS